MTALVLLKWSLGGLLAKDLEYLIVGWDEQIRGFQRFSMHVIQNTIRCHGFKMRIKPFNSEALGSKWQHRVCDHLEVRQRPE
jgi:hypothetical protein